MASSSVPQVKINEHAPLWRIVDSLAGSGWGSLREAPQSVRTYVSTFARLANHQSGILEVTDAQLSERTGLSIRTMERARKWLVEAGYLQVLRRGARQGLHGVASILRLGKEMLVGLIPGARQAKGIREKVQAARVGGFKGRLGSWASGAKKPRQGTVERAVQTTYTKGAVEQIRLEAEQAAKNNTGAGRAAALAVRKNLGIR